MKDVIELAKQAGFNASVGKTDKEGNYRPYVNAIGRDVPFEWVERFAVLVRNAALEECAKELEQTKKETAGTAGIEWTVPKYPLQENCVRAIRNLKEPTP